MFPARQLADRFGWSVSLPIKHVYRQPNGIVVVDFGNLDPETIRVDADVYVFQRPQDPAVCEIVRSLRRQGAVVVGEIDDWYFDVPTGNDGRALDPTEMHKTFAACDVLTCATPELAEGYQRLNPNTHVLRNYLDWEMWEDARPQYEVERDRVRVGWMGDARWHRDDLKVIRGVVGPWLEHNPQVDFVAAGDPTVHDILGMPEAQRVSYGGVPFSSGRLPEITATMDIGLVPLAENRFNDCKSHLKAMEYAACGIPCIASPAREYADYWLAGDDNGRVGFLATRPRDWRRALDMLVQDDVLRRQMGQAARAKAAEHTIQDNAWRWDEFYRRLADDRPARAEPGEDGQVQPVPRVVRRKTQRVPGMRKAPAGVQQVASHLWAEQPLVRAGRVHAGRGQEG